MKRRISNLTLSALKQGRDNGDHVIDSSYSDGSLILRVTDSGKRFYFRYHVAGRRKFFLIGRFDPEGSREWKDEDGLRRKGAALTLAAAKEAVIELRLLARTHGDLKTWFQAQEEALESARQDKLREEKRRRSEGSLEELLNTYVAYLKESGKVSAKDVAWSLRKYVLEPFPHLAKRKAHEISPDDIQEILARLVKKGHTRNVNIVRAYLRAAFTHAAKSHYDPRRLAKQGKTYNLQGNPVDMVPRIASYDKVGERSLDEDEIHHYLYLIDSVPSLVTREALRFHLFNGGQRPTQLFAAPWESYDFKENTVELIDTKGRAALPRRHLIPLLPEALECINKLRPQTSGYPWPFCSGLRSPVQVRTLGKAVDRIAEEFVKPFTLRDIRRTAETHLAALGIGKEIRSQLLSHGRGDKIDATYNKHRYLNEKRIALDTWVAFLKGVHTDRVTPMRNRQLAL